MTATEIIHLLRLEPLPGEGGYYRETYRSSESILSAGLPGRYTTSKSFGTAIYYLLTPETCSLFHRLPTDEIYHFYLGSPVTMVQLFPDGTSKTLILGSSLELGHQVQTIVPRGVWQGSLLQDGEGFALMGTTMAPGFDFSDYEPGVRKVLLRDYPEQKELIERLTIL